MVRQPILIHLYHTLEQQAEWKDATINQTTQTSRRGFIHICSKNQFDPYQGGPINPIYFEIRIDAFQTGFLIYTPYVPLQSVASELMEVMRHGDLVRPAPGTG
jgi:hypothetical protein